MNSHRRFERFVVKPFGFPFPRTCTVFMVLSVTAATHASLVPTVFVDTPTQLAILWDWDEFSGAGTHEAGVPVADFDMPSLVNWDVILTTTPSGLTPVWTVQIEVFHKTAPHSGDSPTGNLATLTKMFDDDQFLGLPVFPDVFANVDHPSAGHFDMYQMQIFHSTTGTTNTVKLFGEHVPEPNTLGLLGVASLMLLRRR
ncbi:MAG: PEP-CTERM sorting domain-containing protein [Phycisphaerales bacterium]|nr:PEP-CTERM sorting domain-containing protein [Phycisphaerales bacterium]